MTESLENLKRKAGQLSLAEHRNWDELIAIVTQIIELEQEPNEKALHYLTRGAAYNYKGDHELAIADFDEALNLVPFDPLMKSMGLFYRGVTSIRQENFLDAFADYVTVDECDPVLKTRVPAIYVAVEIAAIYKDTDEEDRGKAFELYFRLLEAISNIQQKQFYALQQNAEVAHYTSLDTLKSLADKGRFRLYNAAYMNDPEEGREFFKIMEKSGIDVQEIFYRDESQSNPSPAFIGSFVKVGVKEPKQKDELLWWRLYGKHDGQEAAGACLIFKHEGTVFEEKCRGQIGAMQQLQSKRLMLAGATINPEEKQPLKPELYKIVYSDEEIPQEFPLSPAMLLAGIPSSDKWNKQELCEKLAESLKLVKKHIEEEKDDTSKKELRKLVRNLLDAIRFLFKSHHYRKEDEFRVVQVRYFDETKTTQESTGIQVDTEQIPPRFYLETHKNFRFSEVILGPQVHGVPELLPWLKERGIKAKKSIIPYRKPYP